MGSWRCQPHFLTTSSYLEASWAHLGDILGQLGPSWAYLGVILGHLGPILSYVGAVLGHLGTSGIHFWPNFDCLVAHPGFILG